MFSNASMHELVLLLTKPHTLHSVMPDYALDYTTARDRKSVV